MKNFALMFGCLWKKYLIGRASEDQLKDFDLSLAQVISHSEEPHFFSGSIMKIQKGFHQVIVLQSWKGAEWWTQPDNHRVLFVSLAKNKVFVHNN